MREPASIRSLTRLAPLTRGTAERSYREAVTFNWDLLLDTALDSRFGTYSDALGSDMIVVSPSGEALNHPTVQQHQQRPRLLKLHGSLNWLACHRCTNLYVNPRVPVARKGFQRRHGIENMCECGMPLSAVMIFPTAFKQYRNRHILNVWSSAQRELASTGEWYFVGYSLPADDIHLRGLLLRAYHMHRDASGTSPTVTVYDREYSSELEMRYRRLLPNAQLRAGGFAAFLSDVMSCA